MDGISLRRIGCIAASVTFVATLVANLSAGDQGLGAVRVVPSPNDASEFGEIGEAIPFRDGPYGDHPHYGSPAAPSIGYQHYDLESKHYGNWYLPKLFGWGKAERCQPRAFRPRGLGNLINPPSTCYRIDYHPFVLKDARTRFGPSYFMRQPDPRCECCSHGRGESDCQTCGKVAYDRPTR